MQCLGFRPVIRADPHMVGGLPILNDRLPEILEVGRQGSHRFSRSADRELVALAELLRQVAVESNLCNFVSPGCT